jgi:hypothetical protein
MTDTVAPDVHAEAHRGEIRDRLAAIRAEAGPLAERLAALYDERRDLWIQALSPALEMSKQELGAASGVDPTMVLKVVKRAQAKATDSTS